MESHKLHWKLFWTFSDKVDVLAKLQNSDFQSHFSMSKIVQIFAKKIKKILKNINLGQQLLLKSFFDKFNFKNNLLLKLGCKIAIFLNLTTLFEKLQKNFWCNFCDSTSISFIVISFHQIPLTWWNAYQCAHVLAYVPVAPWREEMLLVEISNYVCMLVF